MCARQMWVEYWNEKDQRPLWRHAKTGDVWESHYSAEKKTTFYLNPKTGEKALKKPFKSAHEGYDDVATDNQRRQHQESTKRLREYNNMVKRSLINRAMRMLHAKNQFLWKVAVLDVACGKGGDLGKWMHHKEVDYVGFDASVKSIEGGKVVGEDGRTRDMRDHARARAKKYQQRGRSVRFEVLDARRHLTWTKFFDKKFHIVSCQFALHYFFTTERQGHMFFKRVADALMPGGIFIATMSNATQIMRHMYFGESGLPDYCNVTPIVPYRDDGEPIPYCFFLKGSVPNIVEHAVRLRTLDKALLFNNMEVPSGRHVGSFSTYEYGNAAFPSLNAHERAVANLYMAHLSVRNQKKHPFRTVGIYATHWGTFDEDVMRPEQHQQCWQALAVAAREDVHKFKHMLRRVLEQYPCAISRNRFRAIFNANKTTFLEIKDVAAATQWVEQSKHAWQTIENLKS